MTSVTATFILPEVISTKLAKGVYERVGGVVRDSQTKQVIIWLRETGQSTQMSNAVPSILSGLGSVASLLNLGVSTMGFALILQRLNGIASKLQSLEELIKIGFHAKFLTGIQVADKALTTTDATDRKQRAIQASTLLTEARNLLIPLLQSELNQGTRAVPAYLTALALAYTAEALCDLEIQEPATVCASLEQGVAILESITRRYVQKLLTTQPVAYLHPSLEETLPSQRVIEVMRWANPKCAVSDFLARVPAQIEELEASSIEWINSLPPAIYDPTVDSQESWAEWMLRQPGLLLAPWLPSGWVHKQAQQAWIIEHRLPDTFHVMEVQLETLRRLQGYILEIRTAQILGISFRSWQALTPSDATQDSENQLMYLIFAEPILLNEHD